MRVKGIRSNKNSVTQNSKFGWIVFLFVAFFGYGLAAEEKKFDEDWFYAGEMNAPFSYHVLETENMSPEFEIKIHEWVNEYNNTIEGYKIF